MHTQTKTAKSGVLARSASALMQFGTGIVKGNPKRCLVCRRLIRAGESWTKHTSPTDPQYGRYSFIVHDHCQRVRR